MQILHLDSSILHTDGASYTLGASIVAELVRVNSDATVVHRDLVADAIPHLDGAIAAGFRDIGVTAFDEVARAEHVRSATLVQELLASDVIVIGAPMYNFSISTQLKAWIDRIVQPNRTFRYTDNGPVGLAGDKLVIIASTRGGFYSSGPAVAMDFQERYLEAVFGFIGIRRVHFLRAESLSRGAGVRAQAMDAAFAALPTVARLVTAA